MLLSDPNYYLISFLHVPSHTYIASTTKPKPLTSGHTDLHTHTNMVVVYDHALVVSKSGHTTQVSPFSPECNDLFDVLIVDAISDYDCPFDNQTYLRMRHNALYVSSVVHNLLPPFIL